MGRRSLIAWSNVGLTLNGRRFFACRWLQYTYTTDGQAGAVLWLENDGETLLMDELAAATDESYETNWQVGQITLRAGNNVFSLSAPTGEQVSCQMTLSLDEFDEDSLLTEQMDPAVLNVD